MKKNEKQKEKERRKRKEIRSAWRNLNLDYDFKLQIASELRKLIPKVQDIPLYELEGMRTLLLELLKKSLSYVRRNTKKGKKSFFVPSKKIEIEEIKSGIFLRDEFRRKKYHLAYILALSYSVANRISIVMRKGVIPIVKELLSMSEIN